MRFKFRKAVFILFIFVVLAGIHLYIYTQNIGLKYRVTDLKIQLGEIVSRNRSLIRRVAEKENLDYIEKYARERLKMVYPEEVTYIAPSRSGPGKASKEANP
jgi:cell division protein FtsB